MSAREAFTDFLAGDYEKLNFRCYDFFQNWQYCCSVGRLEYTLMDVDGDGTEELQVQYENSPGDLNAVFDYDSGWINCWELDCLGGRYGNQWGNRPGGYSLCSRRG